MKKLSLILCTLQLGFFASVCVADEPINENPLTATAKFLPEKVGNGGTTELQIHMTLAEGHHAYLERFKLAIDSPDGIKIDTFHITPSIEFKDSVSGEMKKGIEKEADLKATIEMPQSSTASLHFGSNVADVRLTYQACTKDHCLFPKTIHLKANFDLSAAATSKGAQITTPEPSAVGGGEADRFAKALDHGRLYALAFVFVIGFLTSLTPCVYPMIPITLAILGTRLPGQSRLRGFLLSATYVLGIATTYSALGVTAASTGALFGAALSNIYVVTALAGVFLLMGLSMYGLFELQVPAFITQKMGAGKSEAGFIGAYFTGLFAGVVASPCVGPVLVGVLAYIAQTQDRFLGFLFLFTFACGMGVLFMLLGAFSQLVKKVPRSGPWMDSVKFIFGTTMVAMALYYIKPIYPQWLFHSLLSLALVLIASFYGAFEPNEKLQPLHRMRKGLMLATFFIGVSVGAASVFEKFIGIEALGNVGMTSEASIAKEQLPWQSWSEDTFDNAIKSGKPVVLDFSANWCAACKELERYTFSDSRVRDLAQNYKWISVDSTESTEANSQLQKRFKVVGLPTLLFFDGKGVQHQDLTLTGFEEAEKFLKRMHGVE